MANLILKVTPEQVADKARQIDTQRGIMDGLLQTMGGYVQTLADSWNSDSGKLYLEKYEAVRREITDSLNNLMTHVTHLNNAAQTYTTLEQEQTQKVNALADNDIF